MTRYEYDEEAGERLHVHVVYEVDDSPGTEAQWAESMRRLNTIKDGLARRILALDRDWGAGNEVCDSADDEAVPWAGRRDCGCGTTAIIAARFGVEYAESQGGRGGMTRGWQRLKLVEPRGGEPLSGSDASMRRLGTS